MGLGTLMGNGTVKNGKIKSQFIGLLDSDCRAMVFKTGTHFTSFPSYLNWYKILFLATTIVLFLHSKTFVMAGAPFSNME